MNTAAQVKAQYAATKPRVLEARISKAKETRLRNLGLYEEALKISSEDHVTAIAAWRILRRRDVRRAELTEQINALVEERNALLGKGATPVARY